MGCQGSSDSQGAGEMHLPCEQDSAGERGEERAESVIGALEKDHQLESYSSLRVPKASARGKHEIDLLVLSPKRLLALEVKHWGGRLTIDGSSWVQTTSRGETRRHEDPIRSNQKKLDDLVTYLNKQGVEFDPANSRGALVLTNPRLEIDPEVARREDVVDLRSLESFVERETGRFGRGFFARIKRSLFGPRAAIKEYDRVVEILGRLPTWDRLHLHGGRIVKGDIRGKGIDLHDGRVVGRRSTSDLFIRYPRSLLLFFRSPRAEWTNREGARERGRPQNGQAVSVKLSGRNQEEAVDLENIVHVQFGWKDESYYDQPKPSLSSYKGQRFNGSVVGVKEYGVFVRLDEHRDGLLHVSRLDGRSPRSFKIRSKVDVHVVQTKVRDGKETIDLELC